MELFFKNNSKKYLLNVVCVAMFFATTQYNFASSDSRKILTAGLKLVGGATMALGLFQLRGAIKFARTTDIICASPVRVEDVPEGRVLRLSGRRLAIVGDKDVILAETQEPADSGLSGLIKDDAPSKNNGFVAQAFVCEALIVAYDDPDYRLSGQLVFDARNPRFFTTPKEECALSARAIIDDGSGNHAAVNGAYQSLHNKARNFRAIGEPNRRLNQAMQTISVGGACALAGGLLASVFGGSGQ